MGNCMSQTGQREFLKNFQSAARGEVRVGGTFASDDPETFQVFVKKRNKFIPGTLKVTENEIVFIRTRCETLNWPLHFLRRYGFTSAGIFFFESGRRCSSGEGLHTFQSHQAEVIFQLVQSRIQDNANMGIAIREARAQSVTGSYHSVHNIPSSYAGTRIQPIQRYSSEGTANVINCSSSSCGVINYHRPFNSRFNHHHRQLLFQIPKRPRSIAGPAHTAVWPLPPSSYHSSRSRFSRPVFMGNIVSEHVIQRQPFEFSTCDHSYVNVLPHRHSATSSPQCLSPVLREYASTSHFSFGSTEQNLSMADFGSQRFNASATGLSHRCPSTGFPRSYDRPHLNSYVNARQDSEMNDREATPSQLDYALVAVGISEEGSPAAVRANSSNTRNDLTSIGTASNINYTKIDLEKTHAVEVAASTVEKENPRRRHFTTNGQLGN
ncbi:PTB domain protein [Onchocerca flexuosa]|uniref:PTB domain protein n=2 Tax=Onchocerca flexuosa TaxID=387005 RepID=A0A238BIM0_9BILA|nr:PTB domain protein [Onchocerca flexuosa]